MTIIDQMLQNYDLVTIEDRKNALKEIMQEIVLAALSKTDFFQHAAFYGGTALRIIHGIDRFSEDLDFTLMTSDLDFKLEKYIPTINSTVESMGLHFSIRVKEKSHYSSIKSAFMKGNTKEQFLIFYPDLKQSAFIQNSEVISIKFEIDIDPPEFAETEIEYRLLPFPYQVRIYDKPSLFAGKLHAVIARSWSNRVKGRDLYDFIYYLSMNTEVNLKHLEARLKQTNTIDKSLELTKEVLLELLNQRFESINFVDAKNDVMPFVRDVDSLNIWTSEFFKGISRKINVR